MDKGTTTWSVGQLAERAGVSVRTLQYYDRIGLLKATLSDGGRRTYTSESLLKLQQILFLKSCGFPLDAIGGSILHPKTPEDLSEVFLRQRRLLQRQVEQLKEMLAALDGLIAQLRQGQDLSPERLFAILELMRRGDQLAFAVRYFDDAQLRGLADRFASPDANGAFMDRVRDVVAEMQALYGRGVDPAGPEGQALAARWWDMVTTFAGGDRDLLRAMFKVGENLEGWPSESSGLREAVEHFLGEALSVYFQREGIEIPESGVSGT